MIKLKSLICEGLNLNPLTTFQQLRHAKTITCYHASESPNFEAYDHPLHVGSFQQATSLIRNMKSHNPELKYYVYEMEISLESLPNFLFDEDPDVDPNIAKHDSYAYSNRIEFPQGIHQGTNISVVIMNPKKQILSKKIVYTSK